MNKSELDRYRQQGASALVDAYERLVERNVELERECNALQYELRAVRESEEALAAHVERIILVAGSKKHGASDLHTVIEQSPKTSLAERDAEVIGKFREWVLEFACHPDYEQLKRKMFRKLNGRPQGQQVMPHNDPEYCGLLALFKQYANQLRAEDKE